MKLTRLRLIGFKSFVEPTDFTIEPGLTGVVGPNGCGKSNLVEAVRWVMGEASYKAMRAAEMDDVIFSGNTERPSRNHAEVSVLVDNADRKAPAKLIVNLPADAKLYVDGKQTKSTTGQRVFVTPNLPAGRDFSYELKVEIEQDGEPVTWTKTATVRAGETTRITLTVPTSLTRR